jgi:hypothetical protein
MIQLTDTLGNAEPHDFLVHTKCGLASINLTLFQPVAATKFLGTGPEDFSLLLSLVQRD